MYNILNRRDITSWYNMTKEYKKRNKDKKREYDKKYYVQNKDKIKEQCKKYREQNKEKINEYNKEYYENNKEKRKEYCEQNKDKIKEQKKEYMKEYCEQNKDKIKEYHEQNKDKIKEYWREWSKSSATYNTFAHQISYVDKIRRDLENKKLLQIKCTYCKEWFNPTNLAISNRIRALEGKGTGEQKLYCSDECKKLCSTYHQRKYPKGQKPYVSRDTQAQWADMVKERDGYKCVKCGSTEGLIAHHKEGIRWNPLESADIDIGVTLCEECNKKAHSIEGCSTYDMRCPT